ncbi:rRNA methyltransferase 1, mitochondrial [Dunckerocampus dactyliophorus]|uniref:rRNA methyltransferase 1, mitochondrial n=1 Tax=Dunckerocampus dactyliophorus TaxID=161453 RepID=UPI002404F7A7|nr:rRNA methyltransferase 1, mitochondrial [Dunckerocampus dactyliophorus]
MSLIRDSYRHRLLFMRIWGLCKIQSVDSQCVFYHDKSSNSWGASRMQNSSSLHHKSQGGVQHNERHRYRLSSELQKLSLEDSSSERGKPARHTSSPDSADDLDIVFGIAPCLLALTQGRRKAFKLFVKDGQASQRASLVKVCEEAHQRGVPVKRVSKRDLNKMSSGGVHQGVCLRATPLSYLTEDSTPSTKSKPLWLVLDGIQDPMNLGAILRSAYFLGVDRVASSLRRSCPLTPVVSKASAGVMEVMGVHGYEDLEDMVVDKVAQGWQVVGTVAAEARAAHVPITPCSHFLMNKPTLLLIGGEGEGLSQKMLSLCQMLVSIPAGRELLPGVESLNVSVATGILLHSLLTTTRTL